jgi:hypothetical protein
LGLEGAELVAVHLRKTLERAVPRCAVASGTSPYLWNGWC